MNEHEFNKLINYIKNEYKTATINNLFFRLYVVHHNEEFKIYKETSDGGPIFSTAITSIKTDDIDLMYRIIQTVLDSDIRVATTFDGINRINLKTSDEFNI